MENKSKPLKAYCVQDDEQCAVIVFATSGAAARRDGGNELGCEWEGVESCRRAPWADQYGSRCGVPAKAWIDNGYWCSCAGGCDRHVSGGIEETEDDDGNTVELVPVFVGDSAYCSQVCKDADEADAAACAARTKEVVDAVNAMFPGVTITWVSDHETERLASFTFPGGSRHVDWRMGEETVRIIQPDIEAWNAYRAQSREA